MRTLFLFLCLALSMAQANAATPTVVFDFDDFRLSGYTNKTLRVVFLSATTTEGSSIILGPRETFTTDTDGAFTITNMVPGTYRIEPLGPPPLPTFLITVPDTNITVYAVDLVAVTTNSASTTAYSQAAANARFVLKASGVATNLQLVATNPAVVGYVPTATTTNGLWKWAAQSGSGGGTGIATNSGSGTNNIFTTPTLHTATVGTIASAIADSAGYLRFYSNAMIGDIEFENKGNRKFEIHSEFLDVLGTLNAAGFTNTGTFRQVGAGVVTGTLGAGGLLSADSGLITNNLAVRGEQTNTLKADFAAPVTHFGPVTNRSTTRAVGNVTVEGALEVTGDINATSGDFQWAEANNTLYIGSANDGALDVSGPISATGVTAGSVVNTGTITNTGRADFAGHVTVFGLVTNRSNLHVTGTGNFGSTLTSALNVFAGANNAFRWTGKSQIYSSSDGVIRVTDGANTDFDRLQLGGTTTNFPAIAKLSGASGTNVIRLGDATLGASGAMLEFMQTPFHGSNPSTDSARIYAKDNAGTAALYGKREDGTENILTPHAMDSPGLDGDTNALPMIIFHRNDYLGTEEWIHLSALAKAVELLLPGKKFVYSRDLPQHERRDWDQDQAAKQAFYDQERARELAEFAAGETNIVVRPVKDIKKPKPVLLNRKKAK